MNHRPMILTLLAVLLLGTCLPLAAQPPGMDEEREARLRQRIEMMRVWKLTELLNLDEERAAVFFPRYQRYLTTLDTTTRQMRRVDMALEAAIESGDGDFTRLLERSFELERRMTSERLEFIRSSADLLSTREQAALMLFERRFHQRLRDMVFELQREMGPPGGGPLGREAPGHRRGRGPGGP